MATTVTNDVTVRANTGNQTSTGTNITTGTATAEIYIETDLGVGAPPEVIHNIKENKGEVIIHATTTMETTSEKTTLHTEEEGTGDTWLTSEGNVLVTETANATSNAGEKVTSEDSPHTTQKNLLSYFTILMRWVSSAMRSLFSWS